MLSIGTPSIVQQRIILVASLVVSCVVVWWQNAGGISEYPVQKFSPKAVPQVFADLDFSGAETAWSNLQIDPQGNLKINALTETALIEAVALMQNQPSELTAARMAFLLDKQFGPTASQQIMGLLPILKRYKAAEQRWWADNGSRDPPPYAELFQLQDELVGESLAKEIFSEQRRLVNVMLASQRIRNDLSLSQMQKDRALIELQTPDLQNSAEAAGASVE